MQIAGPTGAFVAVLAGVTAQYGISWLEAATLVASAIRVRMGVSKMGAVFSGPVLPLERLTRA